MNRRLFLLGTSIAAVVVLSMALMRRPEAIVAAPSRRPQAVTIPAGTKLHIRLEDGISTRRNHTGNRFTALLDGPLTVEGKQVAAAP